MLCASSQSRGHVWGTAVRHREVTWGHLQAHINIAQDHSCLGAQDLARNNSDLDCLLLSQEVWGLKVSSKSSVHLWE